MITIKILETKQKCVTFKKYTINSIFSLTSGNEFKKKIFDLVANIRSLDINISGTFQMLLSCSVQGLSLNSTPMKKYQEKSEARLKQRKHPYQKMIATKTTWYASSKFQ